MYVVAIKDTSAWYQDSVAELSMIGFWNLIVVWLKVKSFTSLLPYISNSCMVALNPLAIFPSMGTPRRNRSSGEHGSMHG